MYFDQITMITDSGGQSGRSVQTRWKMLLASINSAHVLLFICSIMPCLPAWLAGVGSALTARK